MKLKQEEFLKILSDYQGIIHKVNLIYFRSAVDREDNFQEIVYQLWKSFPALKKKDKLASWIYAVAINSSISKLRKDSRLEFYDSIPEIIDSGEQPYDNTETNYQRLIHALQQLNEVDKSIMLLYLEDCSYEEISEIVGITPSNVGVKIHRLKNQLQKLLKEKE